MSEGITIAKTSVSPVMTTNSVADATVTPADTLEVPVIRSG
ncbi:MAG TPA: hypothetical protein VMU54_05215 [Planctomycetota bacterium]|nr:hypothetical protein [Planctomycetota bacterium]